LQHVAILPLINLLVTNTRLRSVDGPELMRRAREVRPDLPILYIVHSREAAAPAPPMDVLILAEPLTSKQLLTAVQALLA
jgi:hypothetical protein